MSEARPRNRTPLIDALLVLAVAVVLTAGGFAGWQWWMKQGPAPAGASAPGGVAMGAASATVIDIYLDPLCPGCRTLLGREQSRVTRLLDEGAQVRFHVVNFLDHESADGRTSSRAANAAYCAVDQRRFREYLGIMMPALSASTTDDQLISLGRQVGIVTPEFAACVHSGRYLPFTRSVSDDAVDHGYGNVPAILVNGQRSQLPTDVAQCSGTTLCR